MDLYQEILAHILSRHEVRVSFSDFSIDADYIVDQVCYKMLSRIRDIVRDDSLRDEECFEQIERIVCEFERLDIDTTPRHDFG